MSKLPVAKGVSALLMFFNLNQFEKGHVNNVSRGFIT